MMRLNTVEMIIELIVTSLFRNSFNAPTRLE